MNPRSEVVAETFLEDELARRLVARLDHVPATLAVRDAVCNTHGRVTVRGLVGSARALMAAWLHRSTARTVVYLVPHGDAFEEARDDLEYFLGRGGLLAFPEPDQLPYDPISPHPGITAQRLETLARLAGDEAGSGVVLATIRGTWQPPCLAEFPHLRISTRRPSKLETSGEFPTRAGLRAEGTIT